MTAHGQIAFPTILLDASDDVTMDEWMVEAHAWLVDHGADGNEIGFGYDRDHIPTFQADMFTFVTIGLGHEAFVFEGRARVRRKNDRTPECRPLAAHE